MARRSEWLEDLIFNRSRTPLESVRTLDDMSEEEKRALEVRYGMPIRPREKTKEPYSFPATLGWRAVAKKRSEARRAKEEEEEAKKDAP